MHTHHLGAVYMYFTSRYQQIIKSKLNYEQSRIQSIEIIWKRVCHKFEKRCQHFINKDVVIPNRAVSRDTVSSVLGIG